MNRSLVAALAFICMHTSASACDCAHPDELLRKLATQGLSGHHADVFYGRVIGVRNLKEARVRPIEVFQGGQGVRILREHPFISRTTCARGFLLNEEFVYFPDSSGFLRGCSNYPATERLLNALRAASRKPTK
jgi:hypothetical protein